MIAARRTYCRALSMLSAGLVAGLLLAAGVAAAVTPEQDDAAPTGISQRDRVAQRLLTEHDCWTGPAPKSEQGRIPGHAIVDVGDGPVVGSSKAGFAIWLDGADGHLYGFCR